MLPRIRLLQQRWEYMYHNTVHTSRRVEVIEKKKNSPGEISIKNYFRLGYLPALPHATCTHISHNMAHTGVYIGMLVFGEVKEGKDRTTPRGRKINITARPLAASSN